MNGRRIALTSLCSVLLTAAAAPCAVAAEPEPSELPEPKTKERRHRRKKLPHVSQDALRQEASGAAAAPASGAVSAPAGASASGAASVSASPAAPSSASASSPTVRIIPAPGASSASPPPALPAGSPYDVRYSQPGAVPPPAFLPPPQIAPAPPEDPEVARQHHGRALLIAGLSTVGGSYLLSIGLSSFSYAGFYRGQWGWLIPLVGPIVSMTGADGGLSDGCPAGSCQSKNLYTYFAGLLNVGTYLTGIGLTIAGGVLMRPAKRGSASPTGQPSPSGPVGPVVRVVPYTPGAGASAGLLVLGRF